MKVVAFVVGVSLLLISAFIVVQVLAGTPTVYLDHDGAVFVGRRRIVGGDEPDLAERLRAHLERRKPLPAPLRIEVEPGGASWRIW